MKGRLVSFHWRDDEVAGSSPLTGGGVGVGDGCSVVDFHAEAAAD